MIKKWKRLSSKVYIHSPFRKIEDVEFELPNGKCRSFSLKKEDECVAILALTPEMDVLLARQYRPGPDDILDEIPGGKVEEGEPPEKAAMRELLEETGYRPSELIPLGRIYECGYSTIKRWGFVALNCQLMGPQNLDEAEFVEVLKRPIPQFIEQLMSGKLSDPEVGWMGLYKLGLLSEVQLRP